MHREIRDRLTTQKEVCNEQLRKIISSITNFVERKLQEAEDERNEMEHPEVFARGDDSQSDFGGDESDREPMPIRSRQQQLIDSLADEILNADPVIFFSSSSSGTSRANSRRPSVNAMTVSPIKRQMMLPAAPGLSSPPRRRRSSAVPPRAFVESRLGRNLSNAMNGFPPNSAASSRSTSRSRSPMPPNASLESDRQSPSFGVEVGDSDSAIPSTFLATLQVVIDIATEVLDTSITALTSRPGSCPELVQKVQHIGSAWDDHPDWPERGW
jgi:serine/threonine-protein kinase RIM15